MVEEGDITSAVSSQGKNPQIPALPNLEQKVKGFISNTDHAMRSIMELAQLFYPEIKSKGWEEQLCQTIKSKLGDEDPFTTFVNTFKEFTEKTRKIRNTIEHPDNDNVLTIENYKLTPANILDVPSVSFRSKEYNLPKMRATAFMESTTINLLTIFELLMAYLCNLHAEPFAGNKRVVVPVPEDKREDSAKHVCFEYQILWTK